jgi:hypothetical protein
MSHYSLPTPSAAATGKMTMGPGFRDEDEPRVCGQHIFRVFPGPSRKSKGNIPRLHALKNVV